MILLTMDFYIAPFARRLFLGTDGKIDIGKVEASYDKETLDELRDYPGLIWKIWSIEENGRHGSGTYLFADEASAKIRRRFAEKFYNFKGMLFVRCKTRIVLENCSAYTRAPLNLPANPPITEEQARRIMHPKLENPLKMLRHKKELISEYERGEGKR